MISQFHDAAMTINLTFEGCIIMIFQFLLFNYLNIGIIAS